MLCAVWKQVDREEERNDGDSLRSWEFNKKRMNHIWTFTPPPPAFSTWKGLFFLILVNYWRKEGLTFPLNYDADGFCVEGE